MSRAWQKRWSAPRRWAKDPGVRKVAALVAAAVVPGGFVGLAAAMAWMSWRRRTSTPKQA